MNAPDSIIVAVGDSPAQCVTRMLAACKCNQPEGHAAVAPQLLAMVVPNEGDPEWPYALVLPDMETDAFDYEAEGIHVYGSTEGEPVH